MNKILISISALGFLILLGGCGYQTQTQPKQAPVTAPATNNVSANNVSIQNFTFSPAELKIKAGTTVTWINNDSAPHDIKADSFSSPKISKGESFSFKFENSGSYDYICGIHPAMKGKIIVE